MALFKVMLLLIVEESMSAPAKFPFVPDKVFSPSKRKRKDSPKQTISINRKGGEENETADTAA
jgi:hypothetical protein